MSPLLIAVSFNYSDIAKLLLENNCDVNLSCKDKKTPLYIASLHNHIKTVKLLLEYKSNNSATCVCPYSVAEHKGRISVLPFGSQPYSISNVTII
jgi:ankyrin repeat protein